MARPLTFPCPCPCPRGLYLPLLLFLSTAHPSSLHHHRQPCNVGTTRQGSAVQSQPFITHAAPTRAPFIMSTFGLDQPCPPARLFCRYGQLDIQFHLILRCVLLPCPHPVLEVSGFSWPSCSQTHQPGTAGLHGQLRLTLKSLNSIPSIASISSHLKKSGPNVYSMDSAAALPLAPLVSPRLASPVRPCPSPVYDQIKDPGFIGFVLKLNYLISSLLARNPASPYRLLRSNFFLFPIQAFSPTIDLVPLLLPLLYAVAALLHLPAVLPLLILLAIWFTTCPRPFESDFRDITCGTRHHTTLAASTAPRSRSHSPPFLRGHYFWV